MTHISLAVTYFALHVSPYRTHTHKHYSSKMNSLYDSPNIYPRSVRPKLEPLTDSGTIRAYKPMAQGHHVNELILYYSQQS